MKTVTGSAYVLVVIGILAAKCFGFLRDIVFASIFGASEYTDIYFQIFGLASLVFTGIGNALATLVIKNLNKSENMSPEKQKSYVAHFITKTMLLVLAAMALLYAFAGPLVKLLLPGLEAQMFVTALKIMYIMLPSCIFVIVAYVMAGVLQNCGVFFVTSIVSLPYNALIIASLMFDNISITAVSIITTIGWFLHIVVLLPSFYRKGYSLFGALKTGGEKRENNSEVLYIFISSMMFQITFMIDKAAVSADGGAASMVNYASNLFVTIASVFVVAMSNVEYPSICRHYENKNTVYVKRILCYIMTVLFAIFVPFILTVGCFGTDIISLLYQRGEFTAEMSNTTAVLFAIYTFGIFGYVCQELFNKILYLGSKYKYTVLGTAIVVILKPFINMIVAPLGGAVAVSATTTVLFTLYAICILVSMTRVIGNYFTKELALNLIKILAAGAVAFAVYIVCGQLELSLFEGRFGFAVMLALCAVAYAAVLVITGCLKYMINKQNAFEGQPK